jgi:hypothetical protein
VELKSVPKLSNDWGGPQTIEDCNQGVGGNNSSCSHSVTLIRAPTVHVFNDALGLKLGHRMCLLTVNHQQ